MTKILVLDIETAPNVAYVWRFFKENIGTKQVLEQSTIMSFAYKWLGEEDIYYTAIYETGTEKALLKPLINILDKADIVIAHNGDRFDLPTIRGRALVEGLSPPSPYRTIDTLKIARQEFNFPKNSLDYLAKILKCAPKASHKNFPGFELWVECLKGNPKAWEEMEKYNIQDVETLEEVYLKMRPWARKHPNVSIYKEDDKPSCPNCGSSHIQWRGYVYTNSYKYRRFQCQSCNSWSRTRFNEYDADKRRELLTNTH